jgi:hypothetical protein
MDPVERERERCTVVSHWSPGPRPAMAPATFKFGSQQQRPLICVFSGNVRSILGCSIAINGTDLLCSSRGDFAVAALSVCHFP